MSGERDEASENRTTLKRPKVLGWCWLTFAVLLGYLSIIWRFLWFNLSPVSVIVPGLLFGVGFVTSFVAWWRLHKQSRGP